jgi:hypothetical protein
MLTMSPPLDNWRTTVPGREAADAGCPDTAFSAVEGGSGARGTCDEEPISADDGKIGATCPGGRIRLGAGEITWGASAREPSTAR